MSNIIDALGLMEEDVRWWHLATCRNMHVNNFYDYYENDQKLAKQIDEMCTLCPVVKLCYAEGVKNKEKGVWGGVYLDLGRVDKQNNSHKTPEIWKRLKKIHGRFIN
jgi:hypothetical protein